MLTRFVHYALIGCLSCLLFIGLARESRAQSGDGQSASFSSIDLDERQAEALSRTQLVMANSLWQQHRVRETLAVLHQIPQAHRRLEWRLANRIFKGSGLTLIGHRNDVTCVAFSPDGSQIVSGDINGQVLLWDSVSGQVLWSCTVSAGRFPDKYIAAVGFDRDQSSILCYVASGRLVKIDLKSGEIHGFLDLEEVDFGLAQFFDHGSQLMIHGLYGGLAVVDTEDGRIRATARGQSQGLVLTGTLDVAIRPDGQVFAIPSGTQVTTSDVESGEPGRTFRGSSADIRKVMFSPDGSQLLAANKDNQLLIWDYSRRRLLRQIQAPDSWFTTFAISPDGQFLATAGNDGTIRIWNGQTGQLINTLPGHSHWVNQLVFSPDGDHIASVSRDGTVRVWDRVAPASVADWCDHQEQLSFVATSPDGEQAISAAAENSLRIWDVASGQEIRALAEHPAGVADANYSPDGARVASGDFEGNLFLWDCTSGDKLWHVATHSPSIKKVAFHPRGQQVASCGDGPVELWNAADGAAIAKLAGHGTTVFCLAFSPDGHTLASGDFHGVTILWDLQTFREIRRFQPVADSVRSLAFSPDGLLLATIENTTLNLWDVSSGRLRFSRGGHRHWINGLTFADDGTRLITSCSTGFVKVWDVNDGSELFSFDSGLERQEGIALSPEGNWLGSFGKAPRWQVLNLNCQPALHPLLGHEQRVTCVTISPDGNRIVSGSEDQTVKVWEASSGRLLHTLTGHHRWVVAVAVSPDGKFGLSAGRFGQAKLWDLQAGRELREFHWKSEPSLTDGRYSPNGELLIARFQGDGLVAWDIASGDIVKSTNVGMSFGDALAISRDGQRVATVGEGFSANVYDTATWDCLRSFPVRPNFTGALAFSPDGTQLATASETLLKIWNVESGQETAWFQDLPGEADSVCFHPAGTHLVTGHRNGEILLHNLETDHVQRYQAHGSWIGAIKYSPDGTLLASSSADGSVLLMDMNQEKSRHCWLGMSQAMTGLDFSPDGSMLVTIGDGNTIYLWDVITGKEVRRFSTPNRAVRDVAFSPDGKFVAALGHFEPVIWQVDSGEVFKTLTFPTLDTFDVRIHFSSDGSKFAIQDWEGRRLTWETATGRLLTDVELPEPDQDPQRSKDGKKFVFPQSKDVGLHVLP